MINAAREAAKPALEDAAAVAFSCIGQTNFVASLTEGDRR